MIKRLIWTIWTPMSSVLKKADKLICVSKLTIIASDNGLSPGWRQAIIWNNDGILSIGLLGTNFSEILIEILTFSFKKMRLKVSTAKWRPFCLGLNVLRQHLIDIQPEFLQSFMQYLTILNCVIMALEWLDCISFMMPLAHCGQDKMDTILQSTLSNSLPLLKTVWKGLYFDSNFTEICFQGSN